MDTIKVLNSWHINNDAWTKRQTVQIYYLPGIIFPDPLITCEHTVTFYMYLYNADISDNNFIKLSENIIIL